MVAKLLYLEKRTKPECLTAVSFLATRVTRCTADDIGKLARLVRYIRRTKDRGVVLRPGLLGIRVRVFVDAAFGVHTDFRSHTGRCVMALVFEEVAQVQSLISRVGDSHEFGLSARFSH